MPQFLKASLRMAVLLAVPALLVWASGHPFLFPSLGPSAFSLVVAGREENTGRRVVGGHLIGIAGGLFAYHLIAHGVSLTDLPAPFSVPLLRLMLSAVVSVAVTGLAMLATEAQHPPACATTLIISLGLLPTYQDVAYIIFAIALMYGVHLAGFRSR